MIQGWYCKEKLDACHSKELTNKYWSEHGFWLAVQEQPLQAGMVQCFDNKLNQKASCMLHFLKAFTSSNAKLFSPLRQTVKLKPPLQWKILLPSDGTTHRVVEHSRWTISHNFPRAMLSKYIPRPYLPWYCITKSGPTAIFASRVWKNPVGR